jgi:hypothetical protein
MVMEPQEPFVEEPIPAEDSPPMEESEPSEMAWIVRFELSEQPRPAEVGDMEEKKEAPSKAKITLLFEMVTGEGALIEAFVNRTVRFEPEI